MLACYVSTAKNAIPVTVVTLTEFSAWLEKQTSMTQHWLESTGFRALAGHFSLLPNEQGICDRVICCVADKHHFWGVGALSILLPEGVYELHVQTGDVAQFAMAWGLGAYQFTRYKAATRKPAQLLLSDPKQAADITALVESIYGVRDLINTPANDMGPSELAEFAEQLAKSFKATVHHIVGDDLLKKNYPAIHAVGRACDDKPRLIDLHWGDEKHPRLTLVGKGVCFDTGGLNIKLSSGMLLMKKDMGGAAHVLGLARMIMQANLPVRLRVLIPAVENSISGNAYRPSDVITSRKGITIEVGNTDAEGRIVLADALTEAASDDPDLIIDMATLTGAARVALGTDLPALFANNDAIAAQVLQHADQQNDPIWRMPLFAMYREAINSQIADINNNTADSYAGAITAALFLKEFVPDTIPWMHFDLMAWNVKARPGRPQGGEAMALRALFAFLKERYA